MNLEMVDFTTMGNVERIASQNSAITVQICGRVSSKIFLVYGESCGFQIDSDKFDKLCKVTEDIYFDPVNGVGWYHPGNNYLTSALQKVFERSKFILDQCILPIVMTSEEASEANNKNLRKFRMNHERKNTWKNAIHDVFFRLVDINDPVTQDTPIAKKKRSDSKKNFKRDIRASESSQRTCI